MRPVALKVFLIFLNVLFFAALGGSVYLVFFTKKANFPPPSVKIPANISSQQNHSKSVGYSSRDLNSLTAVFSSPVTPKKETSDATEEADPEEPVDLTEIDNLVVIGVIYDTEVPEDSVAVLFDKETGEQINLFAGDEYKGWALGSVEDRITIMLVKGETSQKLVKTRDIPTMNEAKVAAAPSQPAARTGTSRATHQPSSSTTRPKSVASRMKNTPPRQWNNEAVNGRIKKTFRKAELKELLKQKGKLMNEAYAKPFLDKGKSIGMQVTTIAPNSQLNQFGLQPGDIVVSWNGQPITSEADCYRIMRQYETNIDSLPSKNEIIVIRNGERVILDVDLQ